MAFVVRLIDRRTPRIASPSPWETADGQDALTCMNDGASYPTSESRELLARPRVAEVTGGGKRVGRQKHRGDAIDGARSATIRTAALRSKNMVHGETRSKNMIHGETSGRVAGEVRAGGERGGAHTHSLPITRIEQHPPPTYRNTDDIFVNTHITGNKYACMQMLGCCRDQRQDFQSFFVCAITIITTKTKRHRMPPDSFYSRSFHPLPFYLLRRRSP